MSHRPLAFLSVLAACLSGLVPAEPARAAGPGSTPTLVAGDDVLLTLEDQELTFGGQALTANDVFVPGTVVEILSLPDFGELKVETTGSGPVFTYQVTRDMTGDPLSDPPFVKPRFVGEDTFTYRLVDGAVQSEAATVTLRVSPVKAPLAGRWKTVSCNDPACAARTCPAFSAAKLLELGWFHSPTSTFVLCDLVHEAGRDPYLDACEAFESPQDIAGWTPLVGDWDLDGWDDVGAHDPTTGAVLLFEYASAECPAAGDDTCLKIFVEAAVGQVGDQALAGAWGAAAPDGLGFYAARDMTFRLGPAPSGYDHEFVFGDTAWRPWPLAGDWDGDGDVTVALYDAESRLFYLLSCLGCPTFTVFNPGTGASGEPYLGVPFSARLGGGCESPLGLLEPLEPSLLLFIGNDRKTVPVTVPKDPGGE